MEIKRVQVVKRSGKGEDFDMEKLINALTATGLRPIDAEETAARIADALESSGKLHVTSLEIRDKVFQELERLDASASGRFAWHQSFKDKGK